MPHLPLCDLTSSQSQLQHVMPVMVNSERSLPHPSSLDWRWDLQSSPRDVVIPNPRPEPCGVSSPVIRQNSAPETLQPPGEDCALASERASTQPARNIVSPPRQGPTLTQPVDFMQAYDDSALRLESPRDRCASARTSAATSSQVARWPRKEVSAGRRDSSALRRATGAVPPNSDRRRSEDVSPMATRGSQPNIERRRSEEVKSPAATRGGTVASARSPRDDRLGVPSSNQRSSPGRSISAAALPSDQSGRNNCNSQASVQLLRELDDVKRDNSKLQEKFYRAKAMLAQAQRQSDEMRAERDRERLRAESFQKSHQQLLRQLKKETAKVHQLERQLSGASRSDHGRHGSSTELEAAQGQSPYRRGTHSVDNEESTPKSSETTKTSKPDTLESDNGGCVSLGDEATGGSVAQAPELVNVSELVHASPPQVDNDRISDRTRETKSEADEGHNSEQRSWEFVLQGQYDISASSQPDFASKQISCFPEKAAEKAAKRGVSYVCSRGRRLDANVPNQDDFVVARHTLTHGGHIALYAVFDGHGPSGHLCASYARSTMPENLFGQRTLLLKPEETLRVAFRETQAGLVEQNFDTEISGTAVALALVLSLPAAVPEDGTAAAQSESWLFVAHVGDARAILASHRGGDSSAFTVTALTRDHRPDDSLEAERIRRHGGEIRKLRETSGAVRVFAPGQDRPALALTRSLGATASACCGVIAEPDISAYRLRPGVDVLILVGTDGLFEFCSNSIAAGQLLKDGISAPVLEDLCRQSRERWAKSSYNETVDDITAIAATLHPENS